MRSAVNQFLYRDEAKGIEVWIKRMDLQFPQGIGNKAYKLKYNFKEARRQGAQIILSFGGAFSNHIAALARLGKEAGFQTIGIIRGDELGRNIEKTLLENPTLANARENGMQLEFVSRQDYRLKHTAEFRTRLQQKFGAYYELPEGGANTLAVKACKEILDEKDKTFEVVCVPVGTGGTMAGIINAAAPVQKVIGFAALKADLKASVSAFTRRTDFACLPEENFGGFAKINEELISFINAFKQEYSVLLDPIYTGKMMFSLREKIKSGYFKENSRILAIHTGGLQGIPGMNLRLNKKGLPLIKI